MRDAHTAIELEARADEEEYWCLPVVAETVGGTLNDVHGQHIGAEHVREALSDARGGPVAEGSVGGGTGMICHEFKGGIGTASRRLAAEEGGWTVGALVQANYGRRSMLCADEAPVGRVLTPFEDRDSPPAEKGSIIVALATDAPLLPHRCERLAQRASIDLGRMGGGCEDGSGDIFLVFATANGGIPKAGLSRLPATIFLTMIPNERMTPLFYAAAEATEEAILNALLAARTVTGRDSITAYGLTPDLLLGALDEACAPSARQHEGVPACGEADLEVTRK